jgi:hypothetical protein
MIELSASGPPSGGASPAQLPRWARFDESTQPFRSLYGRVTFSLLNYAASLAGGSHGTDYLWFKYLVDGFEAEYQKWATNPHMRSYLERTDELSKAGRLVLYAYLHIAYDLPRVIADSLLTGNAPARIRCKQIFARADFTFIEAFGYCSRIWSIFGVYSIPLKCLYTVNGSLFDQFVEIVGKWPLVLRNEAWDLGERLASAPNRQEIEEGMWRFVDDQTRAILKLTKSPRKIVTSLISPRLCVVLPTLIFFFDDWLIYLAVGLFVLALIGGFTLWVGYRRLILTSELVGRELYKGIRSMRASFNEGITKDKTIKEEVINFCTSDETIKLSKIESLTVKLQNFLETKTFEPEETIDLEAYNEKKPLP